MDVMHYFAHDYRGARSKFLEAALSVGATLEALECSEPSPDDEPLFTDVATVGDPGASRVLVLNSATHGVEGFCGSGAMVGWLRTGGNRAVPDGTRVVLIHAINPYGFAWLRRGNVDNVDLNRNFVDHDAPPPPNPEYGDLHPHLLPARWDETGVAASEAAFADYAETHGAFALQAVLSRGQYTHPDGLFYGGNGPTWSNRAFRGILERHVHGASHVGFIDFHTGLGPYGTAELIASAEPGTPGLERLWAWYGAGVTSPAEGNSSSAMLSGTIKVAVEEILSDARVTSVTAEYGTYPVPRVLRSLQADNWLHERGELDSELGRRIKAEVRHAFYPDEDDWKELVFVRARQIVRRALAGLAAS